jgi:hypothetical protein
MSYVDDVFGVDGLTLIVNLSDNTSRQVTVLTATSIPVPLPEPATLALFGFGLSGLGFTATTQTDSLTPKLFPDAPPVRPGPHPSSRSPSSISPPSGCFTYSLGGGCLTPESATFVRGFASAQGSR